VGVSGQEHQAFDFGAEELQEENRVITNKI